MLIWRADFLRILAVMTACAYVSLSGAPVQAEDAAPASTMQPASIDRNGAVILIRSALLAVHQANVTGNYTVLRDLGSPAFRDVNSAARLSEIFANLRNQKLDLSGTLVLDPQLTVLPEVSRNGMMHMAGFFPSAPLQVNFDLIFTPAAGRWDIFDISVNIGQGGPTSSLPAVPSSPLPEAKPGVPVAMRVSKPPKPKLKPAAVMNQPEAPATTSNSTP